MKPDIIQKLKAARALVARPGGWTQKAFSRGKSKRAINDSGKVRIDHICFCAVGAMVAVGAADPISQSGPAAALFARAVGLSFAEAIVPWNDAPTRTQAEVVLAFDAAITLAEAGAS